MLAMFLSAIIFGCMGFLVKILSFSLSPEYISFARFFTGLITISSLCLIHFARVKFNNMPLLISRGLIGGVAILFYFKAISAIPLADAVIISFSYPIFAAIFAAIYLKEKLKPLAALALALAFLGIILIADPDFSHINIGYVYGLISAVCAGAAVTLIRQLRLSDNAWSISLALMIGGTLICGLASWGKMVVPPINIFSLLITASVLATMGQLLLTYGYKFCTVAEGGIIAMITIPVSVLLAVIFLQEDLTINFLFGSILIISSAVYLLGFNGAKVCNHEI